MLGQTDAEEVLDREFLPTRARLLQVAAALDRIGRAEGDVADDPRLEKIVRAIEILGRTDNSRAEQIQLLFSLPYDETWRETFSRRANAEL